MPSFVVAVFLRYWEDRGRQFGALLSYYGFISLFPLLLVLVTVLGIVLDDDPDLRDRILDTVYEKIPVVGAQLHESTTSLSSSGLVLLAGLLVSLWSGLAVVKHAQDALNLQWAVPRFERPGIVLRSVRALGALAVVGVGVIVATAATSLAAFLPDLPWAGRIGGAIVAILLNVVVLTTSYRVLVHAGVGWRALAPGGIVGGVASVGPAARRRDLRDAGDRRRERRVRHVRDDVRAPRLDRAPRTRHPARERDQRGPRPASVAPKPPCDATHRRRPPGRSRPPCAARCTRTRRCSNPAVRLTKVSARPAPSGCWRLRVIRLVDPDERGHDDGQRDHDHPLTAGQRDGVEQSLEHVRARPRPR